VLQRIYDAKRAVAEREGRRVSYQELRSLARRGMGDRRPFLHALRAAAPVAIVAEVKRASPSAGLIAPQFEPRDIARAYEAAGADAVSVLTEQAHFLGELAYLEQVRSVTTLPLLRKDFLQTRYDVAESAAFGADCILLIVAGISDRALRECMDEAREYALDSLVEVHDETELHAAIAAGAELVGINNRDLRTFQVDLAVSGRLLPLVPHSVFALSESGIRFPADVSRLRAAGTQGVLIGEALMRSDDPRAFISTSKRV
jgi:indole-3-glycerol phosphate synthase